MIFMILLCVFYDVFDPTNMYYLYIYNCFFVSQIFLSFFTFRAEATFVSPATYQWIQVLARCLHFDTWDEIPTMSQSWYYKCTEHSQFLPFLWNVPFLFSFPTLVSCVFIWQTLILDLLENREREVPICSAQILPRKKGHGHWIRNMY